MKESRNKASLQADNEARYANNIIGMKKVGSTGNIFDCQLPEIVDETVNTMT